MQECQAEISARLGCHFETLLHYTLALFVLILVECCSLKSLFFRRLKTLTQRSCTSDFKSKVSGLRNVQRSASLRDGQMQHQYQPDYKALGICSERVLTAASLPHFPSGSVSIPRSFPPSRVQRCTLFTSNMHCFLLTSHGCLQIQA